MSAQRERELLRAELQRVDAALGRSGKQLKLLAELAWPRRVEQRFFAAQARELPEVRYEVDTRALEARVRELTALEKTLSGASLHSRWLRDGVASLRDACRLALTLGTKEFHALSKELYGSADTVFEGSAQSNLQLAEHLLENLEDELGDEATEEPEERLDAEQLAQWMRDRAAGRTDGLEVTVTVDEELTSKAIAGTRKVRVRKGATFDKTEAESLWTHEVETHALTAQNGERQAACPALLRAGGPRSTRTQEGLAIFAELYAHTLTVDRMKRLALRVRLVHMAEQGADFLQVYRFLLEQGSEPREAFLDAQRIFRGGVLEGGAPFTKDSCYLAGLLQVYSFLAATTRAGMRDELEMLVVGRLALEDLEALVYLRKLGVLTRPPMRPPWVQRWGSLVPYMSFAAFFPRLELAQVADRWAGLRALAAWDGKGEAPEQRR